MTITDSLIRAIGEIEVADRSIAYKAVNQLEFASHIIGHGVVPASLADALKTSFEQKVGQIQDLGVPSFMRLDREYWVTETYAKLALDAGSADGNAEKIPSAGLATPVAYLGASDGWRN